MFVLKDSTRDSTGDTGWAAPPQVAAFPAKEAAPVCVCVLKNLAGAIQIVEEQIS